MKIIIIGDGKVGYSLAENLSNEEHDITIIDRNSEALKKASEQLDVMCIKGSGVSAKILIESGVKDADLLIAATSSDEINMVCCLTGKKLGAEYTVARIRDPEYANELSMLKTELGLDMVINPEQAAAYEIARLLRFPSAANIESFAKGRVDMVEVKVTENLLIAGMDLKTISAKFSPSILIGAVVRDNEVIIPNGDFTINANDIIYVLGKSSNVYSFIKLIKRYNQKIKNVMIVGGGRVAYYLTNLISSSGMKVKVVEANKERCIELSELLSDTLIIHGDGTDEDLLHSENLREMDAFVALMGIDEENLVASMLAKQSGVHKVIAKINRTNYSGIIKNFGIDSIVNPKIITSNLILRRVRGLQNAQGNTIQTLYKIIDGQAEAAEFIAGGSTKFLNIPLKDLKLEKGVLVAVIVRKNEIIIPHGSDVVKQGDSVILITKNKNFSDLNDIIATGGLHNELQNGIKKLGDYINL